MSKDTHILVVDDEKSILDSLQQILQREGYRVSVTDCGSNALDLVRGKEGVDLVLADIMMPKMSGFEVCENVKQDPELQDTKICLLTAKGQEADRERGRTAGADEYITKPFDPDEIYDMASETLGIE